MSPATPTTGPRALPPVLGRLMSGTFWLALRTPLQVIVAFWSIPLIQHAIGRELNGAYVFAWGFGFLQFLLEFGMSSALQRQVSETWTRDDREGTDRAIACGMAFYAVMAVVQAAVLLSIAYITVPYTTFGPEGRRLIVRLLWLQAVTAPCYGLATVVSSVLQAARRYDVIPKLELLILLLRFAILVVGLSLGFGIFPIVAAQTAAQVVLSMGPAIWIMVRELGVIPKFVKVHRSDFLMLLRVSFYVFLIQLSVVLADKLDTTVLGYALPKGGDTALTIYQNVSKPFLQIRQTGWMLSFLVMPAVASLAAAHDERGLERIKYDGSRMLIGLLLPITLLAWIYARPFLAVWIDPAMAANYRLLRLFLIATMPLVLSVLVQMAIGMGKVEVIALAALAGAVVNLPLSYVLTLKHGVAGVIWGTVLTTLVSNLLVPGLYCMRALDVRLSTFLKRALGAPMMGAVVLLLATWAFHLVISPELHEGSRLVRLPPFLAHLSVGVLAYLIGYSLVPVGRADLADV
ncbi:MAG: polysaccharide biosynthesis C-terminal domain-containing protein, partial [Isosphaeraceae bacterium]